MQRVALITGAAKRLGRSIALALADDGWDIAVHYNTSAEAAERTAEDLRQRGATSRTFRANLSQLPQVRGLVGEVCREMGGCELLVNNASIFERGLLRETDEDLFERMIAVNLRAPLFLCRDFAEHAGAGQIVNLLDTRIRSDRPTYFVYSITKKALADLTRMAARELGPNIRVNGVCPGLVLEPPGEGEGYLEKLAENIPLQRCGGPEDVVAAVMYLVRHTFVTGELLFADGGEKLM